MMPLPTGSDRNGHHDWNCAACLLHRGYQSAARDHDKSAFRLTSSAQSREGSARLREAPFHDEVSAST